MTDIGEAGGHPFPNPFSGTHDEIAWKHRPPYTPPSGVFGAKWHGGCQCGQVQFQINRQRPLKSKYCHCRQCQQLHGAPFQWAAIFHKTDVAFVTGAEGLRFYSAGDRTRKYELPTKVSCAYCGSPIMDEGRNMCMVFPTTIERSRGWREAFDIDCHIFYAARVVDLPDGKPKWSGLDGHSERIE